jgi:hypothetical protein
MMVGATTDPTYLQICNAHLIVQRMASAPSHCTLLTTRKELRKALDSCDATDRGPWISGGCGSPLHPAVHVTVLGHEVVVEVLDLL